MRKIERPAQVMEHLPGLTQHLEWKEWALEKLTDKNYETRDTAVMFLGLARADRERYERLARHYAQLAVRHGLSMAEVAIALDIPESDAEKLVS